MLDLVLRGGDLGLWDLDVATGTAIVLSTAELSVTVMITLRHSRVVWFSTTTVPSWSMIAGRGVEHAAKRRMPASARRARRRVVPAIRI